MFINTQAANSRWLQPKRFAYRAVEHDDASASLLEASTGSDAPPTYLEATSPGTYAAWSGYEENTPWPQNAIQAGDGRFKEERHHHKRNCGEQGLNKKWLRRAAFVMFLVILGALFAELVISITPMNKNNFAIGNPFSPFLASETLAPSVITQPEKTDGSSPPILLHPGSLDDDNGNKGDGEANTDSDVPQAIEDVAESKPSEPSFPIRWPSGCGRNPQVKTQEHDFGAVDELYIEEAVHKRDGQYRKVRGWIHIIQAPANQEPGTIRAKVSYAVSSHIDLNSVPYISTKNGILIGDPLAVDDIGNASKGSDCLGISIVLYMAHGVMLDTLNISALHMGIQIHNGADFFVTKSTSISLTSGSIHAAALNSRETRLRTTSGSIGGRYTLSDLLSVETNAGTVVIDIEPEGREHGAMSPAVLQINAISGTIRVNFPHRHLPERDYQTMIKTAVGSVYGKFVHGSRTEFRSEAGSIQADLLPLRSGDYRSEIYTNTRSGLTNLTLSTPYKAKNAAMKGLVSTHRTTSGGLNLWYPDEWVGFVRGTALQGTLHLQGNDLALMRESAEPGQSHVEARKGDSGSSMAFDTVDGACEVTIGKA